MRDVGITWFIGDDRETYGMRQLQILAFALRLFFPAAMALAPVASMAQTGKLSVDLNKFEPAEGGGCRAFFLFRNQTGLTFEGFEMSLAILDGAGVIDRLLTIDAAPIPVGRTTLKRRLKSSTSWL